MLDPEEGKMSKKVKTVLVAVVCVALILWAYSWNRSHYGQQEVVIGAVFDLTGSLSYMGQWSLEGAKLAEKDVNAAGGIDGRKLRLLVDDAETNPQKAVTVFKRMAEVEELPVVIGFNGSSEVMAAAPVANRSHVVLFSTGGASPRITEAGDYVFRNRLSGAVEAARMADIAHGSLGLQRGVVLYIDTDYGQGYADAFRQRFIDLGGTVLSSDGFKQDESDFRVQLSKIRQMPDLEFVYLAAHVREAGSIFKQAKELGIKTRWLASNAIEGPELFKIAGDSANGVMLTVERYDPAAPNAKTFNEAYRKQYKRDSEMFAAHAYDAVRILASIIASDGYNAEEIRTALYDLKDYPGVSGRISFDKNGDVITDVVVKKAQDGQFLLVAQPK